MRPRELGWKIAFVLLASVIVLLVGADSARAVGVHQGNYGPFSCVTVGAGPLKFTNCIPQKIYTNAIGQRLMATVTICAVTQSATLERESFKGFGGEELFSVDEGRCRTMSVVVEDQQSLQVNAKAKNAAGTYSVSVFPAPPEPF